MEDDALQTRKRGRYYTRSTRVDGKVVRAGQNADRLLLKNVKMAATAQCDRLMLHNTPADRRPAAVSLSSEPIALLQSHMLWEDIRGYDLLQDIHYLSRVIGGIETDRLIAELVDLLHTDDVDKVSLTCLAIRDLIIVVRDDDHVADFQRTYHGSAIVTELERLARDGKRKVQRAAVYTLGKTGCTGSVPILIDVFRSSMQSDPLVLPEVLFEICWLDRSRLGALVDEMLASPSFLARWASLEGPGADIACGRLVRDPHDLVRAEAIFHLALIDRPVLTRSDARRKRKELDGYRPSVSFSDLRIMFDRWLREGGRTDCSVDEIEMFVDTEVRGYITTKAAR